MREVSRSICESLMHHSGYQPSLAGCAGDGTCSSHMLRSLATANQPYLSLAHCVVLGVFDSAPACAYVAGTLSLIQSLVRRANTPS